MDSYRERIIAVCLFLFLFLLYLNLIFYSIYQLPVGQVDVDNYLRGFYGSDPLVDNLKYVLFYSVVSAIGEPKITLLWLPPLLVSILLYLIFLAYSKEDTQYSAFIKTLLFTFLTFNIWFYFGVGIYRQLFAMVLLLTGYALHNRHRNMSTIFYLFSLIMHINLLPIFILAYTAKIIHREDYEFLAVVAVVSAAAVVATSSWDSISFFIASPQPSFYLLFMVLTNPFLWYYGLQNLRWTPKHILLTLLIITMPFSDQGRGMIFLHLLLVDVAYDTYVAKKECRHIQLLLLFLSYLWFQNMIIFLVKSTIINSFDRGLDLSIITRHIGFNNKIFIKT